MWQRIKAFLINAIISASIGLTIGLTIMIWLSVYHQERTLQWTMHLLFRCILIGLIIGSVSLTSVIVLYRYLLEKTYWGYVIVFLVTGIGSVITSYPFDQPLTYNLIIIAIAETLAILATYINSRYLKLLNRGLKRKQAELKQNIR